MSSDISLTDLHTQRVFLTSSRKQNKYLEPLGSHLTWHRRVTKGTSERSIRFIIIKQEQWIENATATIGLTFSHGGRHVLALYAVQFLASPDSPSSEALEEPLSAQTILHFLDKWSDFIKGSFQCSVQETNEAHPHLKHRLHTLECRVAWEHLRFRGWWIRVAATEAPQGKGIFVPYATVASTLES